MRKFSLENLFGLQFVFLLLIQSIFIPFILADENLNLFGSRVNRNAQWKGKKSVPESISILIMAGHADSQGFKGQGTAGEAVALMGKKPMDSKISDELFWNLKVRDAVVRIGKEKGLRINSYEPINRNIIDENESQTNWSVGSIHAKKGGYSLEIHFDSFGKDGIGSGLIPPLTNRINYIDEELAQSFGRYPIFFRGGLGAPRRQIRILEIGKLEGRLEKNLRDLNSREKTIDLIAHKVVDAIIKGINKKPSVNLLHHEDGIFLLDSGR